MAAAGWSSVRHAQLRPPGVRRPGGDAEVYPDRRRRSRRSGWMAGPVTVVWDEALAAYDFGPEHPLRPARVQLTMALARSLGLLERARVTGPVAVSGTDLARV